MFKQKAKVLVLALLFFSEIGYGQAVVDTIRLYFNLDERKLNKTASTVLDSLLYYDFDISKKYFLIVGYADHLGSTGYNDTLSVNRALDVRSYLTNMGIAPDRITACTGRGEIKRLKETPDGYPVDRRVDVFVSSAKMAPPPGRRIIPESRQPKTTPGRSIETVKEGETFVLDNIYFYPGRHVVRKESLPELENLYQALQANKNIKIRIEGHICCVRNAKDALDEDTFEHALSINRAKYIYEYLTKRGIDPARLSFAGFGRSRPLVANELTVEDENRNRRVEIRVLKN